MARAKPRSRRKSRGAFGRADMERKLLEAQPPSFHAWHVPEPKLLFAAQNQSVDPKTGLALYGPFDAGERPVIRVGIIGSGETIAEAVNWLQSVRREVEPLKQGSKQRYADPILFPPFPGFTPESAFRCEFRTSHEQTLAPRELEAASEIPDPSKRIQAVVDLISERLQVIAESESPPDVVIAAMPANVERSCRTGGGRSGKKKIPLTKSQRRFRSKLRRLERQGQRFLFDMKPAMDGEVDEGHANFRRYLKVCSMRAGIPTQLVWPGTFVGTAKTQDLATIAWNLVVGLYYKARGIPWRVAGLDPATCYVGVSFYRELGSPGNLRTSMAQAFSQSTDGIVLRGESLKWDSRKMRSPHLDAPSANRLLAQVLSVYERTTRQRPARVVIHKSSFFTEEEANGFQQALGDIPHHDFVALRYSDVRMLRIGYEPPIRGTALDLGAGHYLLYTRGYIPFVGSYPGLRIPGPLEIHEHIGTGTIQRVCEEVMALTKMNWNTADFACGDPITQAFARRVGRVLAEMDKEQRPASSYRFYM